MEISMKRLSLLMIVVFCCALLAPLKFTPSSQTGEWLSTQEAFAIQKKAPADEAVTAKKATKKKGAKAAKKRAPKNAAPTQY